MTGRLLGVFFCALPLVACGFSWPCKPTAELKTDCVRFARENGMGDFADRIAGETNLTDWIDETVRYCEERLTHSEGADHLDPERRRALMLLDYPLHVDNYSTNTPPEEVAAFERAVIGYQRRAIARVIREVREAKVEEGALRLWHVYNMAYVMKGCRHTVLIDFTPYPYAKGKGEGSWTVRDLQALAGLGDMLVITHPHLDHVSIPLMREMRALGKPLVLPCAIREYSAGPGVTVLDTDHAEPVLIDGVKFRNFMGNQGAKIPCNTYQMEIDGVLVADNGDNYPRDRERMLSKCPPTDVIISSTWNCVTNIVAACVAAPGFRRDEAVFLPSHDNEVMHSVPHRESYREMYTDGSRLGCPGFAWPRVIPLGWGESLTFRRRK